jgi:hypothetical protein
MITCMCWGVGGVPDLLMMWPKTSTLGTMKVYLLRLMVKPLAASTAKNWSRWSRCSTAILLPILLSSK